jgi:hypothetical protein
VVAVGDQSDGVSRMGNQREKRLKKQKGNKEAGAAWGGLSCLWGSGRLRFARRPTPQTPRDAMLDSDVSSDVLACVLVMLRVLIYLRGCSSG